MHGKLFSKSLAAEFLATEWGTVTRVDSEPQYFLTGKRGGTAHTPTPNSLGRGERGKVARRQTSWSCCSAAKWWGAHCPNGHSSNSSDVSPRTFALVILSLNKEVDLRKMYGELIHSLVGIKNNQSPLEEKKHSQSKLDPKCQCKTSPESLITHWAFFIRE